MQILGLVGALITIVFMLWFLAYDIPHLKKDDLEIEERYGRLVLATLLAGLTDSFFNSFPHLVRFLPLDLLLVGYFAYTGFYFRSSPEYPDNEPPLPWHLP